MPKPGKLPFSFTYAVAILLILYSCRTAEHAAYLLRCGSLGWYWTGILRMLWLLCRDTTNATVNLEPFCTTAAVKNRKVTQRFSQDSLHLNSMSEPFLSLRASSLQVGYTTTAFHKRSCYCPESIPSINHPSPH